MSSAPRVQLISTQKLKFIRPARCLRVKPTHRDVLWIIKCWSPPSDYTAPREEMVFEFIKTVSLFSQSDMVPILGPSVRAARSISIRIDSLPTKLAVALVLAGPTDLGAFIRGFVWLELHLLTFEIKNQITGLEEDRLSKPNRPIVAGRISVGAAQDLYWVIALVSTVFSAQFGLLPCTVLYLAAIFCYNELAMSRNWFCKSFLGSIGYVCYCWGTTVMFDHGAPLSTLSTTAIVLSGLLHTTTGHAQDFRDRDGDAAIGRVTLPMILSPRVGRWSLALLLAAWTAALIWLWAPPALVTLYLGLLGLKAAAGFIQDHSVEADRVSYWWYNIWLITAHLLPAFAHVGVWNVVDPVSFLPLR
ncbi:unnamed protein product [Mycena citricolor]|uniref:UbiA prenyltransferase n=1 Tax=Mycena citricolor TaxID=2018698 RepID=A0AAD2Q4J0_9AGAR|nr:unnamed protein product [Mycena citricolor]